MNLTYNGDGMRVKSVMQTNLGTTTTYFVGSHYEVANGVLTKYYFAGTQRIAMRKNGVLNYIIGDHLGSTSIVTDDAGNIINQTQYKAWGEVRYSSGTEQTSYGFTGQFSYAEDFGLLYYNARWYDSSLGRFAQADSIVPAGVQGWDRYAYVNNSPVKYTDPSGHMAACNPMEDDCHTGSDSTSENNGGGGNHHDDDVPDEDGLIAQGCNAAQDCWVDDSPPSYCGGGPNGLYDVFDCIANGTQDLALVIDAPFAGTELVFLVIGCPLGGLKGCIAGAKLGQTFFKYTGANAAETRLGFLSTIFSIAADLSANGTLIGENTVTVLATFAAGTISKDPIVDFIIDGYGSAYNHDLVNSVYSFIPFDSYPFIWK